MFRNPVDRLLSIGLFITERALERGADSLRIELIESVIGSRNTASQFGSFLKGPSFAGELGNNLFNPLAASVKDTFALVPALVIESDTDFPSEDADELDNLESELSIVDFASVIVDFILFI